ncbi:IbrB-like domain-containing protein [Methylocystis sp. S23]|jgi:ParB-like chromosome segregation protein Spo0J
MGDLISTAAINDIKRHARELASSIAKLDLSARIEALNEARAELHAVSPFAGEPVDYVAWVKNETVSANDYNPNTVAPPEMKLLELSILQDGYTQPIVTHDLGDKREVVDGFHRNRVGKESKKVRARVSGYLPVVTIRADRTDETARMSATIRHNRARGKHGVEPMTGIVMHLSRKGWDDEKISKELGMDADEVLRFKQVTGLAELFADREFSEAWDTI